MNTNYPNVRVDVFLLPPVEAGQQTAAAAREEGQGDADTQDEH